MKLNITIPKNTEKTKPVIATKSGWESPIGWWNVTTEGDCEGRSVRDLGTFYGHVAEIALATEGCYYSLKFEPHPEMPVPAVIPSYEAVNLQGVNVTLGINSKTWDMDGVARAKHITEWFDTRDVVVRAGQYFASVTVILASKLKAVELKELQEKRESEERDRQWKLREDEKKAARKRAIAKLSAADRAALGISG